MFVVDTSGITTIEEVRKEFNQSYENCHRMTKIMLKSWLNHSESRNRNNNTPFTFDNYTEKMNDKYYLEQVQFNLINCDDIGGKEEVIKYLEWRINK